MELKIEKIWITTDAVCIRTTDGREASELLCDYPRLRHATQEQLHNYQADAYGIHWPDLDEDLCFEGFFREKTYTPLYKFFMAHPELNASAIARRMGISQGLMMQYISGAKQPDEQHTQLIYDTIRTVGHELAAL